MRYPIKINRGFWPTWLCNVLPAANDVTKIILQSEDEAAFSHAVCAFKFGGTFKTTQSARYPELTQVLQTLRFENPPVILDIAASDGSASQSTMEQLSFSKYYITDLNPVIYWTRKNSYYFFYNPTGQCILAANAQLVCYFDTKNAQWPLGNIAAKKIQSAPAFDSEKCKIIELINPAVRAISDRVEVRQHDLFDVWHGDTPQIIIAANILNHVYFDKSTLKNAIKSLLSALDGQGYLAIADNRPDEHCSVFALDRGKVALIDSINGGAATESLVLAVARN